MAAYAVPREPLYEAGDAAIQELKPWIQPGDLVIDGDNSNFMDTERRFKELTKEGFHYMGLGVFGGAEGALWGPSEIALALIPLNASINQALSIMIGVDHDFRSLSDAFGDFKFDNLERNSGRYSVEFAFSGEEDKIVEIE